ncbi:THUMP domain-containing class I SAM-dependent RNA methyltransferase [Aestuariivirga sp.]|uniref:THUMP domain-containing class I SAM-dependent RNA methyltransferase n=1 Tax=Aestuariivirga sp. TaxID=2650926 RepID=UPI0039E2D53E
MSHTNNLEIFLIAVPGLEEALCAEVKANSFKSPKAVHGGVLMRGGWPDVWRANLVLRGASRVLVRIGAFRVAHLAQLDKRARAFPWAAVLRPDVPVRVEASCSRSRIYHSGAAAQRVATALREELGAAMADDADVTVMARIEDDLCTLSLDTSGELLHKRGHKQAVGKAPMRETMASLFLRECGYDGKEPVVDPMCGSGTFVIEAAEIAARLDPGRGRSFAFEKLATFDAARWNALRASRKTIVPAFSFYGSDRDQGAVRMSIANAKRAGVENFTQFCSHGVSELMPSEGPPGLVIVNPPYGARIGDMKPLFALYGALGKVLLQRFTGWRVGIITTNAALAKATELPFLPPGKPVAHGGLKVTLYRTEEL